MVLSRKAKESLKTAFAMAVTYGIALQMEWDHPHWAAFAVAFVSLANIGQSLNKAALRMVGTVVAMVVAMTFIALAAQDRWLFMTLVSIWLALCTYRMGGARHQYFWNVCGFVAVVICMSAGPDSENAFHIALIRFLQTGLGILVYSLVCIFIWPVSSGPEFRAAAGSWVKVQHDLFDACLAVFRGRADRDSLSEKLTAEQQASAAYGVTLESAETDDYEVWEQRTQWREHQRVSAGLTTAIHQWGECLEELGSLPVDSLLPDLEAFAKEIGTRIAQVERMLADEAPVCRPRAVKTGLDRAAVAELTHFQRAALAAAHARLEEIDSLTRSMFKCASALKGFGETHVVSRSSRDMAEWLVPDPDRALSALRVVIVMWLAFFAYLYVDGLPAGSVVVTMGAPFGMIMASMPQLRVSKLIIPSAVGALVGSIAYIFVMPHLSGFSQIGLLIFATTFAFCYRFAEPRQALGRAFGLALFLVIANVSNDQQYSFLAVANTVLVFPVIFLILEVSAHIPYSPRPERTFLRLLGRFFGSCERLVSESRPDRDLPWLRRLKRKYHLRQVKSVPARLGAWARFMNTKALGVDPEAIGALLATVQSLSRQMMEVQGQRRLPQAEYILREMREDLTAWHSGVIETFRRLAHDPASEARGDLRARLDALVDQLESRIMETVNASHGTEIEEEEEVSFYRLLGAYRSVSEAIVEYAGRSALIDWERWREERFA
jgi:uncharacterized membrane protein YccC